MEVEVENPMPSRHGAGTGLPCALPYALPLAVGLFVAMAGVSQAQDVHALPAGQRPRFAPVIPLAPRVSDHSQSVSKQFVVHGRSLELRSAFSKFAETVKGDFLNLLYSTDRGSHPERMDRWENQIVIQIRDEAADSGNGAVTTRIRQLATGGFRIELTARIGTEVDRDELRGELIRVLLAECILRNHKSIRTGGRAELLPAWLMAGVTEILRQKVNGRPSDHYEKVFSAGGILSVEEIMTTNPKRLDALSLKVFELSSAGLIQTLLEQQSGADRMRIFISELAIFTGPQRELLMKHFPGLRASRNSLEKWWALQMASMSEPGVFHLMTPEETEVALTEALIVEFEEPVESEDGAATGAQDSNKPSLANRLRGLFGGGSARRAALDSALAELEAEEEAAGDDEKKTRKVVCRVEDVEVYIGQENLAGILARVQFNIARIGHRSHPLYRRVIQDYQAMIGGFDAETQVAEAEKALAALVARRTVIQRQAEAVSDHLNWYEATQLATPSGKFDAFFGALDVFEKKVRNKRADPMSQYLDALGHEFQH